MKLVKHASAAPRRRRASASATRRPTRWGSSIRELLRWFSSGGRSAATLVGATGNGTGRLSLPVIVAQCEYVGRRATTTSWRSHRRAAVSPVRMEFTYDVRLAEGQRSSRPAGRRTHRSIRGGRPAVCRNESERRSHEGVVTGARIHRFTLTAALLDRGAEVTGIDCFTDTIRASSRHDLRVNAARPGFHFIEESCRTPTSSAPRRKTQCFTSPRRLASARAGQRLPDLHRQQRRCHPAAAERA